MWWGSGIKNRAVDTVPHQSVSPPRGGAEPPSSLMGKAKGSPMVKGVGEGWPIVSLENDRGQLSWINRATLEHPQTC